MNKSEIAILLLIVGICAELLSAALGLMFGNLDASLLVGIIAIGLFVLAAIVSLLPQ